MELDKVLKNRRSIRKYKQEKVSDELLRELIQAGIYAPSWKNSQVARYYVIREDDMLNKVKNTLPEFNFNNVLNAPVLIVTSYIKNRSGFNRDGTSMNEIGNGWGCYDCGMHHMNLLLKAEDLGLSTLVMGIRDEVRLKELLDIDDTQDILSVIAVGYGDIEPEMPKRKDVDDIAKFL